MDLKFVLQLLVAVVAGTVVAVFVGSLLGLGSVVPGVVGAVIGGAAVALVSRRQIP